MKEEYSENLSLVVLSCAMVMGIWGPSLLVSILPLFQKHIKINSLQAGLLVSAFIFGSGILMLVGGLLGDRFGKKKIVMSGLLILVVMGFVSYISSVKGNYVFLLISRVIQGLGAGLFVPNVIAITGDLFKGELRVRALSILESSNSFGAAIAPFFASLLALIFWNCALLVYPIFCFILLIGVYYLIPDEINESQDDMEQSREQFPVKDVIERIKKYKCLIGIFIAAYSVYFIFMGLQSFIAIYTNSKFTIGIIESGIVVPLPALSMSIATLYVSRFGFILEEFKQIFLGFLIEIITLVLLPFWGKYLFYLTLVVIGIGNGFIISVLSKLIADYSGIKTRGSINSVYMFSRALGALSGPIFFGYLFNVGNNVPFYIGSLLLILLSSIVYLFVRTNQRELI